MRCHRRGRGAPPPAPPPVQKHPPPVCAPPPPATGRARQEVVPPPAPPCPPNTPPPPPSVGVNTEGKGPPTHPPTGLTNTYAAPSNWCCSTWRSGAPTTTVSPDIATA